MIEMFNILKQKKDEQSESIIEDGMRYFNLRIKQMKLPPPEKVEKTPPSRTELYTLGWRSQKNKGKASKAIGATERTIYMGKNRTEENSKNEGW